MIENNRALSVTFRRLPGVSGPRDYGPKGRRSCRHGASVAAAHPEHEYGALRLAGQTSTATVDNFVGNRPAPRAKARVAEVCDTLLKL
jgi:hypothetical protein